MEENWRVDFIDSHFRDNFDQFRTKAWGMNYTVGVIAEPLPGWHLGGVYGFSSNLHLKFETSYYSADIKTSKNATTTYPKKIGIGKADGKWVLISLLRTGKISNSAKKNPTRPSENIGMQEESSLLPPAKHTPSI